MTNKQSSQTPLSVASDSDDHGSRTSLESSRSFTSQTSTSQSSTSTPPLSYSEYLASLYLVATVNDAVSFNKILTEFNEEQPISKIINASTSFNSTLLHAASLGVVDSFDRNHPVQWDIFETLFRYEADHQARDYCDRTPFDILAELIDLGIAQQYETIRLQVLNHTQ